MTGEYDAGYENCIDAMVMDMESMRFRIDSLQRENAKLRELLSEVAKPLTNPTGGCLKPGCALDCPHYLECDEELGTCFYVDRMRELGVEVKEQV